MAARNRVQPPTIQELGEDGAPGEDGPTGTAGGLAHMLANRATFQTETVEAAAAHPDLAAHASDVALLANYEGFDRPDNFGLVECAVCKYGVFNEATKDTAMGYFQGMYFKFFERMHTPQLYAYMTRFWNTDVRNEYTHVPVLTVSGVRFHFETCMRRMNVEQRLEEQLDKIERVQAVLESNGLYVEPLEDADGESDEDRTIPPEDRAMLAEFGQKLDALRRFMDRPGEQGAVARKGLGAEAEGRVCHLVNQMASHVTAMSRRRTPKRRRVQVSAEGAVLFDKYCARMSQTAKVLLDWRKFNQTTDATQLGMPAYCSHKATTNENLIDIYSNKRIRGGGGGAPQAAEALAPGDMSGRFAAY
jgi:hypothetical protein